MMHTVFCEVVITLTVKGFYLWVLLSGPIMLHCELAAISVIPFLENLMV